MESGSSGSGNGAAPVAAPVGRTVSATSRIFWILGGAAILTLLTSSRIALSLDIKGYGAPVAEILTGEALRWALWLPALPAILAAERRWGFAAGARAAAIALHAGGLMLVLLLQSLVMTAAGRWAGWYFALDSATSTFLIQVVHEAAATAIIYSVVVGYAHVQRHVHERDVRRAAHASLEARLARERLRVLQMQLHPHFLFNALHAVGGLVRDGDRTTAVETISELGDLLRRSLHHSEQSLVTLHEELEFVAAYLRIQQARYGDLLTVRIRATAEARRCLVPALIVQPLAENAVRHGTSQTAGTGVVEVGAYRDGGRLHISVFDDGPAAVEVAERDIGIGLRNTRARLYGTYGDDFTLTLVPAQPRGTVATITIPARAAEAVDV